MAAVHDEPRFGFQFFETGRVHEIRDRCFHRRTPSDERPSWRDSARPYHECQSRQPFYHYGRGSVVMRLRRPDILIWR